MSPRESFVELFGEQQASAIEAAAEGHKNGVHDKKGSDPFKWACLIAIGYQCVEKFGQSHGITVPFDEFKAWAIEHGEFASHDGDFDYISAFCGHYNEYMQKAQAV